MLHLNTVSPALIDVIQKISSDSVLSSFRLVGGTALSLYLGHRISVDADFFTDTSFDKKEVEQSMIRLFPNTIKVHEAAYGFTWAYNDIKIDLYDWKVPFLLPATEQQEMRLAAIEDVAAYKLDAVVGRKTEKDYRDVAELLKRFSLFDLLNFYQRKFPYNSLRIVLDHLSGVIGVVPDASIVLLNNETWEQVQQQIDDAVVSYFEAIQQQKEIQMRQKEEELEAILARGKT